MNFRIGKTFILAMAIGAFGLSVTAALGAVKLPKTAKLLTKAEIIAVYAGSTSNWDHPNTDKVTGTAIINADATMGNGTYVAGKNKGVWETKITFKNDQYCWSVRANDAKKFEKPVCNLIYLDGKVAYEVHPKSKKILSVNTIQ